MVVDVVVEMDDIDMMSARIKMARDKLTKGRIARSLVHAKPKPEMSVRFRERVNPRELGGETGPWKRVKIPPSTSPEKTVAR